MRLLIVAAFAIVTGAFAGCIGGVGTISAMEGLDPATEAAAALVDGAPQLVAVASLEPFSEYVDEDDDLEFRIFLDDTPGDGLAPGWAYSFVSGDDLIVIGYASGLGVLFEARDGDEVDEGELEEYLISGWEIDSDEAAKILAAHEDWPPMTDSTAVFWELTQAGDCPIWFVERWDAETDAEMEAGVDACTGEVVQVGTQHIALGPADLHCREYADGQGAITPMDSYERQFPMEAGGSLRYSYQVPAGVNGLQVHVYGPDGTRIAGSGGGGIVPFAAAGQGAISGTQEGVYRLEATSDSGAALEFRIDYEVCQPA